MFIFVITGTLCLLYLYAFFHFYGLSFLLWILFSSLFIYITILLSIAAFTLFERKLMGAIQRRLGPNVVGIGGFLQPFADGLKLATKEMVIPKSSLPLFFLWAPVWTFFLSLSGWSFIPFHNLGGFINPQLGFLIIVVLSSLNVYGLLLGGWASNSKYALLGSIRTAAQMVSYEVLFIFSTMPILILSGSCNLLIIGETCARLSNHYPIIYFIGFVPLSLIFFIVILAETNRAPFDLPEAEAELVAGYNVEYSSFIFALYFLGEYSSILIMSSLFVIFYCGAWSPGNVISDLLCLPECIAWVPCLFFFVIKLILICSLFVWIRATLPRIRFDQLMRLCWVDLLPLSFSYIFLFSLMPFIGSFPTNDFIDHSTRILLLNIEMDKLLYYNYYMEYAILSFFLFVSIIISSVLFFLTKSLGSGLGILDSEKSSSFECGFDPILDSRQLVDPKFYKVAVFLIIFDIEIVFLIPWCIILTESINLILYVGHVFTLVLFLGLLIEIRSKSLDW